MLRQLVRIGLSAVVVLAILASALPPPQAQAASAPAHPAARTDKCAPFTASDQQEIDALQAQKDTPEFSAADALRLSEFAVRRDCADAQNAGPADTRPHGAQPVTVQAPQVTDTVGATGATYTTLQAAFTAINNGVLTGAIILNVVDNTTEVGTATLNASGTGAANYTSVLIQPSGGGARTISAALGGNPLVDLNGADNVTFDGLNTGGNSLTIQNTSTVATTGTSTIRFQADATNNIITNASILGSATMAAGTNGGNIWFGSLAVTTGNDNNTISNNNIGPAGANLPTKGIYFSGTSNTDPGTANSGILITNNNIYDYFSATVSTAGIDLNSGSTNLSITNNRLYQTASRTMTSTGLTHSGIRISNGSGNNYQITGNTIGFANSGGTGTYTLVFPATTTSAFIPINLITVGTTTATSVQGNTIAGIAMSGGASGVSTSAPFRGIYVATGLTTVGDVTGNTIGSQSATGSISYTSSSASASDVMALFNFGSSAWTVNNNTIGGITVAGSGTGASNVYGIRFNTVAGVSTTLQNNTIGGTVANSLQSTTTVAGTQVAGIFSSTSLVTASGNTIRNLTAAGGTGTTTAASVIGITFADTTVNNTVRQNTIHTLSNTNGAAATTITGIQYTASTGANLVERNFIHSFSAASTAAILNGIRVSGGTTTYRNNMIRLGIDTAGASITTGMAINGINEPAGTGTDNFYFNSVYIGGTGVGGVANTFAFNSLVVTNVRAFQDNIFYNARSNGAGAGKHYAVQVGGTAPNPTGLTLNYNIYYTSGTGGVFGRFNALDVASLAAWRTAVGQDVNSLFGDPVYNTPAGTAATVDLHLGLAATPAESMGLLIGSVTDDFDGQTRASFTPTDIGADAGNFTALDITPPTITYTALPNTAFTTNRAFTAVTITDASGVNTTASTKPRAYYKRFTDANTWVDNTSGTNGWKFVEANGTTSPFDFTIDYTLLNGGTGVSAGNIVQYFVVAQDLAATPNVGINSGTFAAAPTSVALTAAAFPLGGTINNYTILVGFSGTYTVPGSYPSLTNAGGIFQAINAGALTGNVTISITADLVGETGAVALNQWAEEGAGNYTLSIRPAGAPRTVTGSSASGLIPFNGPDRVTIDGSLSGGTSANVIGGDPTLRNLTFINTNVGTSSAVLMFSSGASGAQNDTVKNVSVIGQDPTTTFIGIAVGGATAGSVGTDNDAFRIENVSVQKAVLGIYNSGASTANPNLGNVFTKNDLSATGVNRVRRGGVQAFNQDGAIVTYNLIGGMDSNEALDTYGIALGIQDINSAAVTNGGITNATVAYNRITAVTSSSLTGYSSAGIAIAGGTTGPNTLYNNMITGVTAPATSPDFVSGIFVAGVAGSTTRVLHNSIALTGDRIVVASQIGSYGLAISGANPVVIVNNNIFYTSQTSSGGGAIAKSYAMGMASATFTNLDSNRNTFWSTGANDGGFRSGSLDTTGTDYATLAAWQTAVSDDANSLDSDPLYVNALSDLHLTSTSPARGLGTALVAVPNDYDAQLRNPTAPDAGADEFFTTAICDIAGTYTDDTFFTTNPCIASALTTTTGDLETIGDLIVNTGVTVTMNTRDLLVNGTLTNNGAINQTKTVNGSSNVAYLNTGGYGGMLINANGLDLGVTTVTIENALNNTQPYCNAGDQLIHRCFNIVPTNTTGRDALITFYFSAADLNGQSCAAMNAYHWNGAGWDLLTLDTAYATSGRQCATQPYSLRVKNVASFSPMGLSDGAAPTALTLGETGVSATSAPTGVAASVLLLVLLAGGAWVYARTRR